MCVIIHNPAGKPVSLETLKQCEDYSSDGIGLATYQTKKGLAHVVRDFTDLNDAVKRFPFIIRGGTRYTLHFRLATSGAVNYLNRHPFAVDDIHLSESPNYTARRILFHNGIVGHGTTSQSDTAILATILSELTTKESTDALLTMLANGNRFLYYDGKIVTLYGKWDLIEGVYFSNRAWEWKSYTNRDWHDWTGEPLVS